MKVKSHILSAVLVFISFACIPTTASSQDPTAREIVKKAYDKFQGQTNESEMTMTIVRPTWKRTVSFKVWSKGRDYSLALITAPAKEKGQTFLKQKNEMWNWVPAIGRMIKLPPSMMSQGWMGSDYSNDDLLKEASIVEDYDHAIVGKDVLEKRDCYKIKLTPKPEAAVVWGSILKWISKGDFLQLKSEYYDEDNLLVKTEMAYNIRQMGNRIIPTRFEIIPKDEKGNMTIVEMNKAVFDLPIRDDFFSQQNMKSVR
jgi:outer membrane lipoprotein-sorting protein